MVINFASNQQTIERTYAALPVDRTATQASSIWEMTLAWVVIYFDWTADVQGQTYPLLLFQEQNIDPDW